MAELGGIAVACHPYAATPPDGRTLTRLWERRARPATACSAGEVANHRQVFSHVARAGLPRRDAVSICMFWERGSGSDLSGSLENSLRPSGPRGRSVA